jgi:uncharacterized phage protein (TIGR02218 family)
MAKTTDLETLKWLYTPGIVVMTAYMLSIDSLDDSCYVANNKNIYDSSYNKTFTALAIKRTTIRSEDGTILNELEIGLDNVDLAFRTNVMMGKYNNRRCRIVMLFAWPLASSSVGRMTIFEGFIDEPKGDEHWVTFQIKPFNLFEREYPNRIFQLGCNWTFCSTPCGLSISNYRTDTTLTAVSDGRVLTCTHGKANDYFTPGFVEIRSGTYNKYYRPIESNDGGTITMRVPFPTTLDVGISIRAVKLCARNPDACINTFNNYPNYGGFSHSPKSPVL